MEGNAKGVCDTQAKQLWNQTMPLHLLFSYDIAFAPIQRLKQQRQLLILIRVF